MRLQLALNVKKLDQAISYYSKMFDVEPHKTREGYANFEIVSPPLKLVLFENPNADEHLNHLGVEMFDTKDIEKTHKRFEESDILGKVQMDSGCCHAEQDKIWSKGETNLDWEWYIINNDTPLDAMNDVWQCCSTATEKTSACC